MKIETKVYAGYQQFYLFGDPDKADIGSSTFWTDDAHRDRLAVGPYVLSVRTDTYGKVPVTVEVIESPSQLLPDGWDHIVVTSLDVPSGKLELTGCPDPESVEQMNVPPGIYEVRVYSKGLLSDPDDGGTWNGDSYLIHLLKGSHCDRKVIKRIRK